MTTQPNTSQHWVDKLVDGILKWQTKLNILELHVDDMKTPSGRVHVGALRGVILHDLVAKALAQKTGNNILSTYVFNDMDNMDSLPSYLPPEYSNHMGRSLHKIPAPSLEQSGIDFLNASEEIKEKFRYAKNMGEFYALDFIEAFRILGCSQEIIWSHQLYESGKMDEIIKQALDNVEKLRKIYKEVADYKLPDQWYPFQVMCENCGLTGSTLATAWDGEKVSYTCQPNKVEWAKGCGHSGSVSPFGGSGKLLWKVDWPGHWKALGVTVEGAGKDHTTVGGSRDMANAICKEVFEIPNPFDIPYEWILIRGIKMSSSKGIGTSAREFVELFPAEVGRFLFVNENYNSVIDFDPQSMSIPDLFDAYDQAARIFWKQEEGDERAGRSFELSQIDSLPEPYFLPRFRDLALWMQHPELTLQDEFAKIKGSPLTPVEVEALDIRKKYAQLWVDRYAPEEYQLTVREEIPVAADQLTAEQKNFLVDLEALIDSQDSWEPEILQQAIFQLAKDTVGSKAGFKAIYLAFLGKASGPKAAWFLLNIESNIRKARISALHKTADSNQQSAPLATAQTKFCQLGETVTTTYPSISVGIAVIRGVSISRSTPELELEKQRLLSELENLTTEEIASFSEIQSYRKLYKQMGVDFHSRRPSPEALLRRIAQKKGLYTINTVVDAMNLIVLKNHVSVGAFDLSHISLPVTLDIAKGGEKILLLGDKEETTVKFGEICYFDQEGAYNLDFNYRDSQRTGVYETTTDLLINVDGIYEIGREQVEQTLKDTLSIITKYCGGTVETSVIVSAQ